MRAPILGAAVFAALLSTALLSATPAVSASPAESRAAATSNPASYPLTTCIVSGETLGERGEVVVKRIGDREVRLCCQDCAKGLKADEASYLGQLDAAIIAAQSAGYPLETCPVSGEALGGMGDPVDVLVGNRLVRLCCDLCKEGLDAEPAKYLAQLDAAVVAAQGKSYAATVCPISGGALGNMGDPYDYVYAGELVRFCCAGCIGAFDADPAAAMAKVRAPATPAATHGDHGDHGDHAGHNH